MSQPMPLSGLRLLIVEDSMLVAMSLEDYMRSMDCREVFKAARIGEAERVVRNHTLDGALLDINLSGEAVYPLADELDRLNVPYIFMTGYGVDSIAEGYRRRPVLTKPYDPDEMIDLIKATFATSDDAH